MSARDDKRNPFKQEKPARQKLLIPFAAFAILLAAAIPT